MAISEFQLALIGAGATAVGMVWGYNVWQEYRYRKTAQRIFGGQQHDALLAEDAAAPEDAAAAPERIEPLISLPESEPGVSAPVVSSDGWLDEVIEVGFQLPSERESFMAAWRERSAAFHKRIRWIARDHDNSEWIELPDNDHAACVTLQLADRQGAIEKDELAAFLDLTATFSHEQDIPALDELLAHARALDETCADVDIQIAIHVVSLSGREFACSKLRGLLEAAGLQLAPDGLFVLTDEAGQRLITVSDSGAIPFDAEKMKTSSTPDVTFWLDVPRVGEGGNVFDLMVATARQLAAALEGALVDDRRSPLTDPVLADIRAKVIELQAQMAAHGIPAGGSRAQRLFA